MNITLFWILLSTFLVSLIAFIGIFALAIKEKLLKRIIFLLIALSAGALMGDAFLHLIPEAVGLPNKYIFLAIGLPGSCLGNKIEKRVRKGYPPCHFISVVRGHCLN